MIIDSRFSPPTPEGLARFLNPEPHMRGYADVYGTRIYGGKDKSIGPMTSDELIALLDRAGIAKVLLKSADNETISGRKYPMDKLADYVRGQEDRLIVIGGVDPHKGIAAIRELEWAVKTLAFRGVNLAPLEHQIHANHRKYYPIYSKCVELNVPVFLHISVNFSTERLLEFGHPRYVDEVAVDFPDLKIVCVHGGWPWVLEMVAVAWRHKNVYIDISGVRTRYIAMPGSGWEPLLVYGNGVLQNKIIWGSNWPQFTPEEGIAGVLAFPLKEEVKRKWLGLNAARLMEIAITNDARTSAELAR